LGREKIAVREQATLAAYVAWLVTPVIVRIVVPAVVESVVS